METTPTPTKPPVALTLGQSLAHVPRAKLWASAILCPLVLPAVVGGVVYLNLYATPRIRPWSFRSSTPWERALLLAWCAYLSVLLLVESYARLYLQRTPVAVVEKMMNRGLWAVGALGLMVWLVLGLQVKDTRVLVACTAVPAAFIVGLVAVWVWLARTYGGDTSVSESESESEPSGVERLPV